MIKIVFENVIGNFSKMVDCDGNVEYDLLMMCTGFTCSKLLYCEVEELFLKMIYGLLFSVELS